MAKYRSQDEIEKWRKEALKRRGRAEEISMDEAERLMQQNGVAGGDEKKMDKIVRLLEQINRSVQNIGKLG